MRPRRVIFFDFDGTLIDSMGSYADAFATTMSETYGLPALTCREEYLKLAGFSIEQQTASVYRDLTGKAWPPDESVIQRFWQLSGEQSPHVFPEVPQVLNRLTAAGFDLAVTSHSRLPLLWKRLETNALTSRFFLALGTDPARPELDKGRGHFAVAARHLNLDLAALGARSVMVGDGAFDMQIGREAGMVAIGRTAPANSAKLLQAGASAVISDLRMLPEIVENRILHR